ncbi:NADH-quinone oxidoreductase subunit L [bacterium]|nr:NADH-quinone oxidoreductase subunit L [bacterium]
MVETFEALKIPWLMDAIFYPYFAAFAIIILFLRRNEKLAMAVSLLASSTVLASTLMLFTRHYGLAAGHSEVLPPVSYTLKWLSTGSATFEFGYLVDSLTVLMLIVVEVVSFLVQVYSIGYMHGDKGRARFYAYLSLFSGSMTALVISPNLLQTYIFWELVGLCSYLLIGFWWHKPEAAAAAKKAFVMTRFGDLGLFLGLLMLLYTRGNVAFTDFGAMGLSAGLATCISLLIFCGVVGKSSQFPLHVWLPDAMEGPTPVSALIHAATMVVAGVYLLSRSAPIFMASQTALHVIFLFGAVTAFVAATMACVQRDIKKVWAYSTISQLGYMVLAFGAASSLSSMFHLFTHAFYKALLFLAAGSFIHHAGSNDLFDIARKGGRRMWITFGTTVVGALALAGIFPFSGFYSKDAILVAVQAMGSPVGYGLVMFTGFLTAYYSFRVVFILCRRPDEHSGHGSHDSPFVMTGPLLILAIATCFVGRWEHGFGAYYLGASHGGVHLDVAIPASILAILGLILAAVSFAGGKNEDGVVDRLPMMEIPRQKYYLDDFYYWVTQKIVLGCSRLCAYVDRHFVDGSVNGVAETVRWLGDRWSRLQTGRIQQYLNALVFMVSVLGLGIYLAVM